MRKSTRAFSLIEMMMVLLFMGILASIAIPRINFATLTKQKVDTVARKIVTDLRRTRRLAISNAATNSSGYVLYMVGSAPYSSYEIRNRLDSSTVDTHSIPSDIITGGGILFRFGPLGNLLAGSSTGLKVAGEGRGFVIAVVPATGIVKCSEVP